MERPFKDSRPFGPFAQLDSDPQLKAIVFYETEIPSDMKNAVSDAVEFHVETHGADVSSVTVGPENTDDSVMITFADNSIVDEDLQKGVSGSVAEIEDMGLKPTTDPKIEIFAE